MRMTCPNCGAQYDVPDDVIPETGRDVQCSSCSHTWFQLRIDTAEPEVQTARTAQAVWDEGESEDDDASADPAGVPAGMPPDARRRGIKPDVADILREEAALEARARKSQAAPLEEQPDLGLTEPEDEAAKRARQASERMQRMRGNEPETAPAATPAEPEQSRASIAAASVGAVQGTRPQSRGDMLPDIDEINSTLRSTNERREVRFVQAELDDEDEDTGGFGKGFIFTILLFAVGALVYTFAPQLGDAVPPLDSVLQTYVAMVDQARGWLSAQIAKLSGMLTGGTAPAE